MATQRSIELVNAITTTDIPSTLQKRFEYNGDGTVLYAGHGVRGLDSTDDGWTIQTFTYTSQQVTLIQTAFGAWSDRSSLTYS